MKVNMKIKPDFMDNIEIRELKNEETLPLDLLYDADPSVEAVKDYTTRGYTFVALKENTVAGVCVLLPTRPFTAEIVNIAVKEEYQKRGIGYKLMQYAIKTAKDLKFKTMEIGTGNNATHQLLLYQKCGFTMTSIDHDFFRRHYNEKIFENGIECRHMVRLSMDLD